jgi:glycosyltransferase involved in cell wall biosynthesis
MHIFGQPMDRSPSKVLLVGDYPPPNGGVATHVEELFRAVRARGGECQVLDIGKGQLPAEGVRGAGSLASFVARLAGRAARGFQIHLHTNGANPKSWLLAQACAAAGHLSGGALITLHSGLGPAWLAQRQARRTAARAVLAQYRTVIAVSAAIRESLERCGVRGVEVLPAFSRAFVKPGAPPPGLQELRAEAAPLFCAMIAPRPEYGESILLEAFARVIAAKPGARLAVYGPGSESAKATGVRGFGELARPQALAVVQSCDVFVRPTLADGDSVSVREALALGREVVATRVGHRPPEARLVPPGDAAALADELIAAAGRSHSTANVPAADAFARILTLYGLAEERCAASAAS